MRLTAVAAFAVLAVLAAAATADEPRRITVTGEGEVEAPPDLTIITAGVDSQAPLAQEALAQTAAAMRAVLDAVAAQGIAPADVQTSRLGLDAIWSDRHSGGDGPPEVTGYSASSLLTVRVRDVAAAGALIDALAKAGANRFDGIAFAVAEPDELEDAALAAAVADARDKAELLAREAGVDLGAVQSVREAGGAQPPVAFRAQADAAMEMPIAAGSVGITTQVEMVFAVE